MTLKEFREKTQFMDENLEIFTVSTYLPDFDPVYNDVLKNTKKVKTKLIKDFFGLEMAQGRPVIDEEAKLAIILE